MFSSTEPNAPPDNVKGHVENSTSIFVSWGQVPPSDQNGVILRYTLTYEALPSGSAQTKDVTAPASKTTLTGLNEHTNYSITVFASTSKGRGNESKPIVIMTDEDSKFVIAVFHADVSSVSCLSERIEELGAVVSLYESVEELCHWRKYGHMNL